MRHLPGFSFPQTLGAMDQDDAGGAGMGRGTDPEGQSLRQIQKQLIAKYGPDDDDVRYLLRRFRYNV